MHVHVTRGDEWQAVARTRATQRLEAQAVQTVGKQLGRNPKSTREQPCEPVGIIAQ